MSVSAVAHSALESIQEPLTMSLFAGVTAASYFYFGNLGCMTAGIMPMIKDKSAKFSLARKVELWNWFYESGHTQFAPTGGIAAISFFTASYLAPAGSVVRGLSLVAAGFMCTPIPFTLLIINPLNTELQRLLKSGVLGPEEINAKSEPVISSIKHDTEAKLVKWKTLHYIRMGGASVGLVAGLLALAAKK